MSGSTENHQQETPAASTGSEAPRDAEGQREPEAARESEAPRSRGAPGRGLAVFALLVALGAAGVTAWQWHDQRNRFDTVRETLAEKLAGYERQANEVRELAREIRRSGADTREKLAALENRVAESQSQQIALEQLYHELSRNRDEWAFAEIEQALLIASQQLQLAGNIRAALIALQSADARLQGMDRPQFTGLRKSLAHDIERLRALPHVDMVGLSARIESLIAKVGELPLAPDVRARNDAPSAAAEDATDVWMRFWREAWAELKQLVRVERMDQRELPLLAPDQRFFLRENLKLRLLSARVALLARDEKSFRDDLLAARGWLERYFDRGAPGVVQAVSSLDSLHGTEISIEAPDLSATIEAMRSLRSPRERGAR